ncbi:hypothetical protein B9479_003108 [Cryptococcus floricola]|uniref:Alpha/beta hydrolase fold-3 domain-containing protein n=1 Tax=Cryptococcus floricola TaxID=2591691 RepID=A0A5D3AZH2_9TREE|nr:hypothetical protein B9479_003108 [Cryptococcus floricola]
MVATPQTSYTMLAMAPSLTQTLPSKGFLVLSADYCLLYPSTADDIIADVHTLFSYVASPTTELSSALSSQGPTLDTTLKEHISV